jgi:hypothetical protein
MAATKVGHALAKVLGIKLQYRNELNEEIRRGESVFSVHSADSYVEEEPRSEEFVREIIPSGQEMVQYARSLFPFLHWIGRYNLQWLAGDLVAGMCCLPFESFLPDSFTQESLSAQLLFRREWRTRFWPISSLSMGFIRHLWECWCTGSSLRLRTLPSG